MAGRKRFKSAEWTQWDNLEDDVFGITENAVFPDHMNEINYQPRSLIDQTLETIDPTPNIHTLFVQFNIKYFWNSLLPVEVKWSTRMTTCAGTCTFRSRNGECVIALSAPLLKLRPRKDLVETLLHEMIHAYLFLTNNNRDRDGHGPEFCKHMSRINIEAGTNITIYHNFHDEVRLYQQHWWKCNGPCSNRAPYFGTVRRAMNRAPGPSDSWYAQHQRTCGGVFVKIREPEKQIKAKRDANPKKKPVDPHNNTLDKWLSPPKAEKENVPAGLVKLGNITNNVHGFGTGGPGSTSSRPSISAKPGSSLQLPKLGKGTNNVYGWGTSSPGSSLSSSSGSSLLPKLGNSTNNVHGFGTGGPGSSSSRPNVSAKPGPSSQLPKLGNSTNNVYGWGTGGPGSSSSSSGSKPTDPSPTSGGKFRISGTLGGNNSGRSCLIDKFVTPTKKKSGDRVDLTTPEPKRPKYAEIEAIRDDELQECPVCCNKIRASLINSHLDECLNGASSNIGAAPDNAVDLPKKGPDNDVVRCPVCSMDVKVDQLPIHVDICVIGTSEAPRRDVPRSLSLNDSDDWRPAVPAPLPPPRNMEIKKEQKEYKCCVCNAMVSKEIPLEEHLEVCLTMIYKDESINFDDDGDNEVPEKIEAPEKKRYPCPVCMEIFPEEEMNEHLDICINNS